MTYSRNRFTGVFFSSSTPSRALQFQIPEISIKLHTLQVRYSRTEIPLMSWKQYNQANISLLTSLKHLSVECYTFRHSRWLQVAIARRETSYLQTRKRKRRAVIYRNYRDSSPTTIERCIVGGRRFHGNRKWDTGWVITLKLLYRTWPTVYLRDIFRCNLRFA